MKLKKHVSILLALGMLTNSIYFNSIANSSNVKIPSRYQTLEGEYITIDDSKVGELHEIEVFGNTVQDENNLENIQSVGDLYVDENGNPILDSQGREQYKIDIVSSDNLFTDKFYELLTSDGSNHYNLTDSGVVLNKEDVRYWENNMPIYQLEPNTEYYITTNISNNIEVRLDGDSSNSKIPFTTNDSGRIRLKFNGILDTPFIINLTTYKKDTFSYPSNKAKTTILLPTQLQKIGSVMDKLYWDNEKGRYIIEKNFNKWIITAKEESWRRHSDYTPGEGFSGFNFTINSVFPEELRPKFFGLRLGNNGFGSSVGHREAKRGTDFHDNGNGKLVIEEDIIPDDNLDMLKEWLENNHSYIYYQLEKPIYIESNITSKIKIPTYENKTYIYTETENEMKPTLKVTVDKIEDAAQDAVDIIESMESNDTLTISTFSLARSLVNQMEESLLKDQLQAKLNSISNLNDLALERKSVTANLDVYIKSESMLSMSINTSSVTFEGYSGTEPMEKQGAINITINSSLPYNLNAYMPSEISNSNGNNQMDIGIFNIKESDEAVYKKFENTNDKVVLKEACESGNNINHSIDLKLDSSNAHTVDVYKTTIKLEAEQR